MRVGLNRRCIGDRKRHRSGAANDGERGAGGRIGWSTPLPAVPRMRGAIGRGAAFLLPSRLWGRVGGGRARGHLPNQTVRPPTPTLPQRGGGSLGGAAAA